MLSISVAFVVRLLLVMLFFPFSALDKILNFKQGIRDASKAIPRPLAKIALLCGFGIEIVMSLAILSGIGDRLAGLILGGYCIVTALLWKQFWRKPDFRLQGRSSGRELFWDFLKNLALAGGFFLLTFGTNAAGVERFLAHPLMSSHPYTFNDGRSS